MMGGTTLATEQPLAQQLARLDADRMRRYREDLDFYQGRQWQESQRRRERWLTFNYARTVVEKTAAYTMSGVAFAVDPEAASPEALERARRTEAVIREVYDANALEQLDFDNEIDCCVLGDAAFKVTWDAVERRVRVTAPDVQGIFAWPSADDPAPVVAGGVEVHAVARRGRGGVRCAAGPALAERRARRAHGRRSLDGRRAGVVARRDAARGTGEPLRLHSVCHLPEHP